MQPLLPIGVVKSAKTADMPYEPFYCPAEIEIKKELLPALKRLEENSHIWVICLYTPRRNQKLQSTPNHIDPNLDSFGILALRSPHHPNPIALTLARLKKVVENIIYVENLDAYNGTPVLDIKPYYEHDIIFSPTMPLIRHQDKAKRQAALWNLALNHHQEGCPGASLAVKMVLLLENMGLNIQDKALSLFVTGDSCLADTLQGLCRARLANPARFTYQEDREGGKTRCCWLYQKQNTTISVREDIPKDTQMILAASAEDLFFIEISSG